MGIILRVLVLVAVVFSSGLFFAHAPVHSLTKATGTSNTITSVPPPVAITIHETLGVRDGSEPPPPITGDEYFGVYSEGSIESDFYPTLTSTIPATTTLAALDGAASDQFGRSVAISSDTAVLGAPFKNSNTGAAYIFTRSGDTWSQQAKLTAADAASTDQFGWSVAIDENSAVVGAPFKNSYTGAAYVFVRSGTAWSQQAKLTAGDAASRDFFGWSVDISGDTIIIGAYGKANYTGAAYVFTRSGTVWSQQAKLTAGDATSGDQFGYSTSISVETSVLGAPGKSNYAGAAYVFTRSGTAWSQQAKITASDAVMDDNFGYSVSVSGETTLVGANGKNSFAGAAYVFTRSGTNWSQQAKLTADDASSSDEFGSSVSTSGETAVVGAYAKNSSTGAAYVFNGTKWSQQDKLTVTDAAVGDYFGRSVSVSGGVALVGAPGKNNLAGVAYVFKITTSIRVEETITVTDTPQLLTPVDILVEETITVTDTTQLLTPVNILVEEIISVTDTTQLLTSVDILIEETIKVTDTPQLLTPVNILVEENISVADTPQLLTPVYILVEETIMVTDTPQLLTPVNILVEEIISVTDTPQLLTSVDILVEETIAVTDTAQLLPSSVALIISVYSPVDISVTDPDGLVISKSINQIPGAAYDELDLNGDGDSDDRITIPTEKPGVYLINVIPEPGALPTDTYTIAISVGGKTVILADHVRVADIPVEGYLYTSQVLPLQIDLDPDTLNLKSKGVITAYIELPNGFELSKIDLTSVKLNGIVPAMPKPIEIGDYDHDGIPDLMVKFDRTTFFKSFTGEGELNITIRLKVGIIEFEGSDVIRILNKKSLSTVALIQLPWL